MYFPTRWHCDALESTHDVQEGHDDTSFEEECNLKSNELRDGEIVLCPPQSKTKGRPKNWRVQGGKELGVKKRKCCSICKQPGYTKPTCPNKENIFNLNIVDEGISFMSSQNKFVIYIK